MLGSARQREGSSRKETVRTHRLQSPFEHWRTGLLAELASFALFLGAVFTLSALIAWIL